VAAMKWWKHTSLIARNKAPSLPPEINHFVNFNEQPVLYKWISITEK
jgi:hypothetical protein